MTEEQKQDAPRTADMVVIPPATETPAALASESAPAEEQKQERLVESALEASHSEVLPLSPISAPAEESLPVGGKNSDKKHGRRGLRRGNSGRGHRDGNANTTQAVGIVENPGDVKETLSGKFVDGYEKDKEPRRARERREKTEIPPKGESQSAQGWCLKEASEVVRRRHPQSNTNANRAKLIIAPAPIPEQEKDPSFWQKFKAKILSVFGLNKKKKKHDKKRRGGKFRNKHGKNFQGGKNDHGGKRDFRGGNRRGRHHRGPRSGNSGARPQGGGNSSPTA